MNPIHNVNTKINLCKAASDFLELDKPDILLLWLRNAAAERGQTFWWKVSHIFEKAAYEIKDIKIIHIDELQEKKKKLLDEVQLIDNQINKFREP